VNLFAISAVKDTLYFRTQKTEAFFYTCLLIWTKLLYRRIPQNTVQKNFIKLLYRRIPQNTVQKNSTKYCTEEFHKIMYRRIPQNTVQKNSTKYCTEEFHKNTVQKNFTKNTVQKNFTKNTVQKNFTNICSFELPRIRQGNTRSPV